MVIDGIADLIKCANDEAESIAVVEEFIDWPVSIRRVSLRYCISFPMD